MRSAREVKVVYGKNTKWLLFDSDHLQKLGQ